jgi:vitamin B12 transporter
VTDARRIAAGGRVDRIRDTFDPRAPAGLESSTATHTAFSPRFGVNLRYLSGGRGAGHVYASVSQSFKAPTLDQLYDLRNIPVPFPPFQVRTSNPELDPQRGTSYEIGLYHDAAISGGVRGSLSLSVYQMDMRDELDIDLATFSYVNIGRSRHRGVETGVNVSGSRASIFANHSLQSVTARSGDNSGNYLKAIPKHTLSGGVTLDATSVLETSLLVSHVRGVFVDDANTVELPDYTRVDARATLRVMGVTIFAEARNLFDELYSSSGFLDPAGTGEAYLYPAAGRVIEFGVRRGW